MLNMNIYTSEDVALSLASLAGMDTDAKTIEELSDAVAWVQAAAENSYNSEYWRTLHAALRAIEQRHPFELPF